MALVWLMSPQYPLAMLPFGVYSIFHVATYTRQNVLPTITPPTQINAPAGSPAGAKPTYQASALSDAIGKFVKEYYDLSMGLVAILEILLWGRLLGSAIIFTKGSWLLLAIYTAFLRARYAQSAFVRGQFKSVGARVDALVGGQGIPPAARQVWEGVKGGARQFHDMSDVGKYVGASRAGATGPAPVKKTM